MVRDKLIMYLFILLALEIAGDLEKMCGNTKAGIVTICNGT